MNKGLVLIKSAIIFYLSLYAVLILNGCAKTTQYDDVWESSLKGCSLNCHSPDGVGKGLDKGPDMSTQDKFYSNVVGKTVGTDYPDWPAVRVGTCDSVQLIKPGDANNSLVVASLVQSVSDSLAAANSCQTAYNIHVTPENVTDNSQAWTDLVKWINDGAPKD